METEEIDFEELAKKSTVGDDLPISVSGAFATEADAQELHMTMFVFSKMFGSVFDLSALDGITVADDYTWALAAVDRGYPSLGAASATHDEYGTGFAMAVPVLRDGVHKSHLVFNSSLVRPLVDTSHEHYGFAVHTVCHEMAHVYDHMMQSKAMPNLYGSQMTDLREATLMQFALPAWGEYAASRLSAHWGTENYCEEFEKSLVAMLNTLHERGEAAKIRYATHRDSALTMSEIREIYGTFFIRASYVTGHLDGLERSWEEGLPALATALEKTTWLKDQWTQCNETLRMMYAELGKWSGRGAFASLEAMAEGLYRRSGMNLSKLPDGRYFVRFQTVPTL